MILFLQNVSFQNKLPKICVWHFYYTIGKEHPRKSNKTNYKFTNPWCADIIGYPTSQLSRWCQGSYCNHSCQSLSQQFGCNPIYQFLSQQSGDRFMESSLTKHSYLGRSTILFQALPYFSHKINLCYLSSSLLPASTKSKSNMYHRTLEVH